MVFDQQLTLLPAFVDLVKFEHPHDPRYVDVGLGTLLVQACDQMLVLVFEASILDLLIYRSF